MANIIEITDISDPQLRLFAGLTEAQLRNRLEPEQGILIAESPKVIKSALDAGCQPLALLMESKHLTGQGASLLARCGEIPVYTGAREVLTALTGYTLTRGILCAMRRPAQPTVEAVCAGARRIAVLENIVDSTNVGAIFRSAAALGLDGVLITPSCSDPFNRRAVRVSMGTVFQVPWACIARDSWPQGGIRQLQALGFAVAAMALSENSVPVDDPVLKAEERLAIVVGTEGDGLCAETMQRSDYTVRIPMAHGVDSLNVGAAAAVAFWELRSR